MATSFINDPIKAHMGGYNMQGMNVASSGQFISGLTNMISWDSDATSIQFTRDEHGVWLSKLCDYGIDFVSESIQTNVDHSATCTQNFATTRRSR